MYLSHIDTEKIQRAEQATAFLLAPPFGNALPAATIAVISSVHVDCEAEMEQRSSKPARS
jgi:hypothetical protein